MLTKMFEQKLGSRGTTVRLAALLLVITMSIVASKLAEERFVKNLVSDCDSLFADRLMPATTLFLLSDSIYQRRDKLLLFLQRGDPEELKELHYQLGQADTLIESHIHAIEKTFLVDDELRLLSELRTSHQKYAAIESRLLEEHAKNSQFHHLSQELHVAFDEVRAELISLTKVQQSVGKELQSESFASASNVTTLLYLQLGVAFVLGILASGLAMSLRPRVQTSARSTNEQMH